MAASTIRVFTFKQGLLSPLAHDLQLTLERFSLELSGASLAGSFMLDSLRVDGAVKRGRLEPGALSDADRTTIQNTLAREVLHTGRHPEASFRGELRHQQGARFALAGELTLAARSAALEAGCELGERIRCSAELIPSRWGIAPYRAMGGALKLQDRVIVELDLDSRGIDPQNLPATRRWTNAQEP